MGCSTSREDLSEEEIAIISVERYLGYSNCTCKLIDLMFRKYASNGTINSRQMQEIMVHLRLKARNTHECPHIEDFYEKFKLDDGNYDFKALLMLGICLSDGKPKEKAKLLFEIFDSSNRKTITRESVEIMIKILLMNAIDFIPILCHESNLVPMYEKEITSYTEKIRVSKEKALGSVLRKFLGKDPESCEEIELDEFLACFNHSDAQDLLDPQGLRTYVLRKGKRLVRKPLENEGKDY
ncbi:unnamed protein product [Blepharisma stoltei]|uniref:Uncharacterized protein n=1 Tax=Blepharisma stoltei TaxID=1481888 RepID=A0AAU9K3F6_9CILI|nr:unnamed protein product [Blepharisma stoltei]